MELANECFFQDKLYAEPGWCDPHVDIAAGCWKPLKGIIYNLKRFDL